jgi:hypothetical protein
MSKPRFVREEEPAQRLVINVCFNSEPVMKDICDLGFKDALSHRNNIIHPIHA